MSGGPRSDAAEPGRRRFFPHGGTIGRRAGEDPREPADEELMQRLAGDEPDALGPLYSRYARLVLHLATQSLDHSAAEELVQEVFLTVWRKAASFDPNRGSFRAWLLEIVHSRILNELRRRSRRPHLIPGHGETYLGLVADPDPEPSEAIQREQRQRALLDALATLPPEQQRALRLAYFDELTHEQVAATTAVPLGTAKTRIRSGLLRLRSRLNPLLVGGLAIALAAGAVAYQSEYERASRYARALRHVTLSDLQSVRLVAASGVPDAAHGEYRARVGADLAVLTVSYLPTLGEGEVYQAWAQVGGAWRSLGLVQPTGADGRGLLIAEGSDLGTLPDAVKVTREPTGGAEQPSDRLVITWTRE
jgi:RNA polymerase sigma factor (sigma-70 family)